MNVTFAVCIVWSLCPTCKNSKIISILRIGNIERWCNVCIVCSDYPFAPPPSRCKSVASLVSDDLLVRIKLKLVDRNCPVFVSKHNSVSEMHLSTGVF